MLTWLRLLFTLTMSRLLVGLVLELVLPLAESALSKLGLIIVLSTLSTVVFIMTLGGSIMAGLMTGTLLEAGL